MSFSLNWNFCLDHGFIIEWNFLFYLVGIFVRTMVSLLSQTSFLLSWNEAQTGFFLSNPQHHVIILNHNLIKESNFCDFSNKLEFWSELRSFYFLRNVAITKIPVFRRILRNSVNNKFIKFVEQQLKIINYSELVPDFSFVINLQCYILALLLNLSLDLILILYL